MAKQALKSAVHHWWPRSLSSAWEAEDGCTTMLSADGRTVRSPPAKFGAIGNAHHIKLAATPTVWDESYESAFDAADAAFPDLVKSLRSQTCGNSTSGPLASRLAPLSITSQEHDRLAECLASLIVRSPNLRERLRRIPEYYRTRGGAPAPSRLESAALLGLNARNGQKMLSESMKGGGKFTILLSGTRELIFGDGFLHNISSFANTPQSPRCLVPVTPEIAVLYIRPWKYSSLPRAFTMNLDADETAFINRSVQVYSSKYMFYRSQKPEITKEFERGEHLEFRGNTVPWLEALADAVANFVR